MDIRDPWYKRSVATIILIVAAPALLFPADLSTLAHSYVNNPLRSKAVELREFGVSHSGDADGMLAYFVLGYSAHQEKDFPAAAGFLRQALGVRTPISDYAEFYLGSSLQNTGNHAAAIPVFSGFDARHPESVLKARAAFALATSLVAVGEGSRAAALLKACGAGFQPAQGRLETCPTSADLLLARAYELSGDSEQAMRTFAEIYYHYPESPEAAEAAKRKARFPKPTVEMLRLRADGLWKSAQHADSKSGKARLVLAAQAAYRNVAAVAKNAALEQAQVKAAAAVSTPLLELKALAALHPADPEADAERLYLLAETNRKLKRADAFLTNVKKLNEQYPGSPWNEEALFSAGNYTLLKRGPTEAARYYAALCEHFPNGKYAAQVHWKLAWTRYREGNREAAVQLMKEQVANYPNGLLVPAALYWLGRLTEESDYFRQAADRYPQSFYGLQAAKRLPSPSLKDVTRPPQSLVRPPDSNTHQQKVAAFKSVGLVDLAAWELRQAAQWSPEFRSYWLVELAGLERERGRYHVALEDARRAVPSYTSLQLDQLPQPTWELLFPLPWWNELKEASAREGIDPYLVAGLIRQESAFHERAVSRVQARGLMQVMPKTGRSLARQIGLRSYSTGALFDPLTNLRLGTVYFKRLLDENKGRLEDALAAYNAGPERVVAWRASSYQDEAEFVESIPFSETREYVQVVLRNAEMYRKLYP